jgi:hypothetical protein
LRSKNGALVGTTPSTALIIAGEDAEAVWKASQERMFFFEKITKKLFPLGSMPVTGSAANG